MLFKMVYDSARKKFGRGVKKHSEPEDLPMVLSNSNSVSKRKTRSSGPIDIEEDAEKSKKSKVTSSIVLRKSSPVKRELKEKKKPKRKKNLKDNLKLKSVKKFGMRKKLKGELKKKIDKKLFKDDVSSSEDVEPRFDSLKVERKRWNAIVDKDNYFAGKIAIHMNFNAIPLIKEILNEHQIELFRATCFGYFLDMPELVFQPKLVHSLLLREVYHEDEKVLWLNVNGVKLRFGIDEFALISGLKCHGDYNKLTINSSDCRLMSTYFPEMRILHREAIEQRFKSGNFESDEDAVKMAVLFFVYTFLFSQKSEKQIDLADVALIDSGDYGSYPWGRELFDETLSCLKGKMLSRVCSSANPGDSYYYRLLGCPLMFQIWFYEVCGYINGICCARVNERIPRILNWTAKVIPSTQFLRVKLFSLPGHKLKLKNLSPTIEEKQQLDLEGFFDKGKELVSEEVEEEDFAVLDDFDSVRSSRKRTSSSKQSFDEVDVTRTLRSICLRQEQMKKDISCLRLHVENKLQIYMDNNFKMILEAITTLSNRFDSANVIQSHHAVDNDVDAGEVGNKYIEFEMGVGEKDLGNNGRNDTELDKSHHAVDTGEVGNKYIEFETGFGEKALGNDNGNDTELDKSHHAVDNDVDAGEVGNKYIEFETRIGEKDLGNDGGNDTELDKFDHGLHVNDKVVDAGDVGIRDVSDEFVGKDLMKDGVNDAELDNSDRAVRHDDVDAGNVGNKDVEVGIGGKDLSKDGGNDTELVKSDHAVTVDDSIDAGDVRNKDIKAEFEGKDLKEDGGNDSEMVKE